MVRRAVDLSLTELATLGAKAAQRAAQKARDAGLTVTGAADRREDKPSVPSVNWPLPPGIVAGPETRAVKASGSEKPANPKSAVRRSSAD
jgi:hypothetical protein